MVVETLPPPPPPQAAMSATALAANTYLTAFCILSPIDAGYEFINTINDILA
jgi:hypothetical protein